MMKAKFRGCRRLGHGLCLLAMLLGVSGALSACMDARALSRTIIKDQSTADKALQKLEPNKPSLSSLVVDERPWYGSQAVPIQNGQTLPPLLMNDDGVVLTFERPMGLAEVARMVQAATGIRVVVEESQGDGRGRRDAGEARQFVPVDGVEVSGGRIVWQGALPVLLNQLADNFDAEWHYDGRSLFLAQELTRTFMLHALADNIDFEGDIDSTEDDDGVLPSVTIQSEASLEIWAEIQETVDSILNNRGRASYSPSTGTITVSATPSLVRRIENYLREQNAMRLRRVAVAVKVLSVQTSDVNSFSFDFNGLIERVLNDRPFQFTSAGDGLTAGIIRTLPEIDPVTGQPLAGSGTVADSDEIGALIEADEDIDRVSLVNSGAIVTLSDIPAPLQIGRTVAYLERVSSTGGDTGGTSLEPGEISLGLTMTVLPRVIQKDRVLLRLAIGITDAETPFQTFGTDEVEIQLPEISTTGFLQNAVLSEGEMLVLAGFEKNQSGIADDGLPGGLFTSGSRRLERNREVTVLLITAEVLPEETLTVSRE